MRLADIDVVTTMIEDTDWYHINQNGELVLGANSVTDTPLYKAEDIYRVLKNAPAVDSVEHGQWIKKQWLGYEPYYTCSICGKGHDQDYDFCNDCGAKMDGGIIYETD